MLQRSPTSHAFQASPTPLLPRWSLPASRCSSVRARNSQGGLTEGKNLWGVEPVLKYLRRRRLEPATVERVYEADVYPAVFDFEGWRQHRARKRYNEHMITLFRSYLLKDLSGPLINATAVAALVATYNTLVEAGQLPQEFGTLLSAWEPFNLMSFALSLMLVFRTNSSYARWVEARALWGVIVNSGRTLVRQGLTSFPEEEAGLKLALARWTVAFARVCKLHLREEGSLETEVASVLQPGEISMLRASAHRPVTTLQILSEIVSKCGGLDSMTRARMDSEITKLQDAVGSSEKILKNPIPLSYTRHTARFLVLWLCVLPFSLWDRLNWGIVPATAVIAFLLLGIDEIAIQLEEPFGILPLENLCDTLQRNVKGMLEEEQRIKTMVSRYTYDNPAVGMTGLWDPGVQPPPGWSAPLPLTASGSDDSDVDEVALAARAAARSAAGATAEGTAGRGQGLDSASSSNSSPFSGVDKEAKLRTRSIDLSD